MPQSQILKLIDDHKNKLIDPVEMLHWTWLRVFIANMSAEDYNKHMDAAKEILCR